MKKKLILATAALALAACSDQQEAQYTPPAPDSTAEQAAAAPSDYAPAEAATAEVVPIHIDAPAGTYKLDPHHSSLHFSVKHLGVSNYVMRFTDFDVTVELDPEDPSASSVTATIDATSIRTDFDGDYEGTHPDSQFSSWEEDLTRSSNFLNADEYPTITFTSTRVEPTDLGTLLVTGDLELRGQTRPVTLETTIVGSAQAHPFSGVGLIGFSAEGSFSRSDFGMSHLVNPPIVGDTVTVRFEGELLEERDEDAEDDQEDPFL